MRPQPEADHDAAVPATPEAYEPPTAVEVDTTHNPSETNPGLGPPLPSA